MTRPPTVAAAGKPHERPRGRCRRFTRADGLILLAATFFAFVWSGWFRFFFWQHARFPPRFRFFPHGWNSLMNVLQSLWEVIYQTRIFAAAWTFALLLLRLRNPRPSFRSLTRQPGMTACFTMSGVLLLHALQGVAMGGVGMWDAPPPPFSWRHVLWCYFYLRGDPAWTGSCGLAVAAVWIHLIATRRWKRERGWIDGWGTCLGAYWIMAGWLCWFSNMVG